MNEIVGAVGILTVMVVLVYGVYIISKPHKFQEEK